MKLRYTLNREGTIEVPLTVKRDDYPCKDFVHTQFTYYIRVKVGPQLDFRGFVVDHFAIHRQVEAVFQEGVFSCEIMCRKIATRVSEYCQSSGCDVKKVKVRLRPIGKDVMAYMDVVLKPETEEKKS